MVMVMVMMLMMVIGSGAECVKRNSDVRCRRVSGNNAKIATESFAIIATPLRYIPATFAKTKGMISKQSTCTEADK
jgi:hypothetical protein